MLIGASHGRPRCHSSASSSLDYLPSLQRLPQRLSVRVSWLDSLCATAPLALQLRKLPALEVKHPPKSDATIFGLPHAETRGLLQRAIIAKAK